MLARKPGSFILPFVLTAALLSSCASLPELQARPEAGRYGQWLQKQRDSFSKFGLPPDALGQVMAQAEASLGQHEQAIQSFDRSWPPRSREAIDLGRDKAEDAIAAIVRESAGRQVVIINEAHHVPMHRAFSMRLARELRKQGFEYLACEAFFDGFDPAQDAVGPASGGYLRDPVFAEFIREARRDGWKTVAYEPRIAPGKLSDAERTQQRETGQAQNLVDRVLAKNPQAKIFIHVGFSHGSKVPIKDEDDGTTVSWMAAELKRLTGIEPLSIDQSETFARADLRYEPAGYREALARSGGSTQPFVLKQSDGPYRVLGKQPGIVDMQVFHPPVAAVQGRSGWLVSLADRKPQPVPAAWVPAQGRRLVYAMRVEDPANASPADLVLLEAGKPAPALMLPAGKFRYEFEDL